MLNSDLRYTIQSAAIRDRGLSIDWGDGHASFFHGVWLRHQCTCTFCGTPINALRGVRLHHLSDDLNCAITATSADAVTVTWQPDGHRSEYSSVWLRNHCYSEAERQRRQPHPTLWTHQIGNALPVFDMLDCEQSPATRLDLLQTVHDLGFCKIVNAPTDAAETQRLIKLVGPQRLSNYGTYNLSKKGGVTNVGDITDALDPHCDETYRLSTVGITIFQVLRPSSRGGHSTLVDGFEAVRRLRECDPDGYDLLTRVPIPAARRDIARSAEHGAKWYVAAMPVIRTDFFGNVTGIRLNERQIMPLDLPGELIEPTYSALKRLFEILYDPDLRLTFELGAGEGLMFDNQRVLHGRTAYEPEEPGRLVLTSSVDIEEFHSTLRGLTEQLHGATPPVLYRQGMIA